MKKWAERAAVAAFLLAIFVIVVGMYGTWRTCSDAGGVTVRGLFGLECIKQ